MRFFKQVLLTVVLTSLSPVLIMLLIGFCARPKPPAPIATKLINPQSAQDWMERCRAIFMNEGGEALEILGKERGTLIDKEVRIQILQQAVANCDRAIQIDPRLSESYLWRGNAKSQLGQTQAAVADYRQAQALLREQGMERDAQGINRMIANAINFEKQRDK